MSNTTLRRHARKVFEEAAGSSPWPCSECGEPIIAIGRHADEGHIHHIDGNPSNNALANLRICHPGCHTRIHGAWSKGKHFSPDHRAALSRSLKGKQNCLGRKLSTETRRKIGESMKRTRYGTHLN